MAPRAGNTIETGTKTMSQSLPNSLRLQKIAAEIETQERVTMLLANSLDGPIFYHSGKLSRGFRYMKPGWRHFCLLKAVRAVSGLNACVRLCSAGFSQEIAVLIRTIAECTTHIDYIVAGLEGEDLAAAQREYVEAFFADFKRDAVEDFGRPRVPQGKVHKVVGAHTDQMVQRLDSEGVFADVDSAKLLSSVCLTHSNYVHSRYPEVMDLFGGDPPRFHLRGMSGTPKDIENLEILETFTCTVSNALRFVVIHAGLKQRVLQDPDLAAWYPPRAA
jgi:hypothetical protein